MARPALLLAALVLLAGCAQPAAPAPAPAPEAPRTIELTDCVEWRADLALPIAAAPGNAPAGWEPAASRPTSSVLMGGFECHRVAVGPFERGPVRLVYDAHTRFTPPQACLAPDGRSERLGLLGSLWVDDAEVAGYLGATLGLPVRHSPIAHRQEGLGVGRVHAWSWGDAAARSTVSVLDDRTVAELPARAILFWPRGDGVGSLTLAYDRHEEPHVEHAAQGRLAPPMLLADLPGGAFTGLGSWFPSLSAHGDVALHADLQCRQGA